MVITATVVFIEGTMAKIQFVNLTISRKVQTSSLPLSLGIPCMVVTHIPDSFSGLVRRCHNNFVLGFAVKGDNFSMRLQRRELS